MGFKDGAKRAARVAFVSVPAGMLGTNWLRAGNQFIGSLWKSLTYPGCPECDGGVLVPYPQNEVLDQQPNGSTRRLIPWVCQQCQFELFADHNLKAAARLAQRARNLRVRDALSSMERAAREDIARGHVWHSRAYFAASGLTLAGAMYMLAVGAWWFTVVQWLLIATTLWIFGMKKSYRAWQARTGTVFEAGSVRRWFRDEKWLV